MKKGIATLNRAANLHIQQTREEKKQIKKHAATRLLTIEISRFSKAVKLLR